MTMQTGACAEVATARTITAIAGRILAVLALGMLIAGCDRCGDWWWAPDQSQSCKGRLPPSR
jgi:hypothetical protein